MSLGDELPEGFERCCDDWRLAHKFETDNEGYGPLICRSEYLGWKESRDEAYPLIGSAPTQGWFVVRYCPFCGKPKNPVRISGDSAERLS